MVTTSPLSESVRAAKDEDKTRRPESHHRPSGRDMKGDSHFIAASRRGSYDESRYSQAHDSDRSRRDPDDESRYSQYVSDARTTRGQSTRITTDRSEMKRVTTRHDSEYRASQLSTNRDPYDSVKSGSPALVGRSHSVKDSSRRASAVYNSNHSTVRPKDSKHDRHHTSSPLSRAEFVRALSTTNNSHRSAADRDPYDSVRASSKKEGSRYGTSTPNGSSTRRDSSSTLKPSVRSEHASSHHTSKHGETSLARSHSKHETGHATDRRHNMPGMATRRKIVTDSSSHQNTLKPSNSQARTSSCTALVPHITIHGSSQALVPRTSHVDWDRTKGMDNSTALMSMLPSRSNRIKGMTSRTTGRLIRAARKQDLDHDEMVFLVDALGQGMIKPSEFADFANFARKRKFFRGFDDDRDLVDYHNDDSDDDDDDDDDDRKLRRTDKGRGIPTTRRLR